MSEHCGYVVKVSNLRKHSNADRLQIATFFGNDTCVSLDVKEGDIGVYFPSDLQLSAEFCEQNHLCRKHQDGTPDIGYLDPDKRNVSAIRLRGEKSDGLFVGIKAFEYTGDVNLLSVGDTVTIVNGHEICRKYIPRQNVPSTPQKLGNRTRKTHAPIAPLFQEHADTEQLDYNLDAFKPGDYVEITLKMHGTSGRVGYLPCLNGYKRSLMDRIFHRDGTPVYKKGYVTGSRRVVLNTFDGGFYGSNAFRKPHTDTFVGKLHYGETVYFEIVGFTDNGTPIMPKVKNAATNDKEFIKKYGAETTFSYGCSPDGKTTMYGNDDDGAFQIDVKKPQSDIYVYRMTMTNEDGDIVEYTPDFMRYRCEQIGVKCVIPFWSGIIPEHPASKDDMTISAGEWIRNKALLYYDGEDPVGKTHVREGVVCRIINRPKFTAYKIKNFNFRCIEGIAKSEASAPDMEEAQEIIKE